MAIQSLITIPARKGKAALLDKGQCVKVINTHGQQVVDTWAFARPDLAEFMSMEHSRTAIAKIMAKVGDSMVTNRRRPILTLVGDTTPASMTPCSRRATDTAMSFWASPGTTIIAPTIWLKRWPSLA